MTVQELINQLSTLDKEQEIFIVRDGMTFIEPELKTYPKYYLN